MYFFFSFCKTDIFYRVAGFVNRGGTSVANKTVKYMAESSVFCSVRSEVYPGFPLCFCLFRRHPIMQHRSVCAVSRAKSTRRTRRRQFENQTSSLMNRQNPSSAIVQKCSRTSFTAIRIDLLNANLNSTRWFETVQRGPRAGSRCQTDSCQRWISGNHFSQTLKQISRFSFANQLEFFLPTTQSSFKLA